MAYLSETTLCSPKKVIAICLRRFAGGQKQFLEVSFTQTMVLMVEGPRKENFFSRK